VIYSEFIIRTDLGSSSKYKDEIIVFGLRWRKVSKQEHFI